MRMKKGTPMTAAKSIVEIDFVVTGGLIGLAGPLAAPLATSLGGGITGALGSLFLRDSFSLRSRLEQGAPLSLLTLYFFAFGLSSRTIDLQQVGVANADAALIITARNWRRKAGQQSAMLAPEGPLS